MVSAIDFFIGFLFLYLVLMDGDRCGDALITHPGLSFEMYSKDMLTTYEKVPPYLLISPWAS
jgi:hypothetical protein